MVTPGVHPAQVEGQTDHIGPDEGYAESCVGGQVDRGDTREHPQKQGTSQIVHTAMLKRSKRAVALWFLRT